MKFTPATQRLIMLAIIFAGAVLFSPKTGQAATFVSTTLPANTTWSETGSPYVVESGFGIGSGVVLTIEPGVVVKVQSGLGIGPGGGTIRAVGTATEPIILTSYHDDATGGDTNGDGGASAPAPGDWGGIYIDGAIVELRHAEIKYGSTCITGELGVVISDLKVQHCLVGINALHNFTGKIEHNAVSHNRTGIRMWFAGGGIVEGNAVSENTDYGIYLEAVGHGSQVSVTKNNIYQNRIGINVASAINANIAQNNIENNAQFGILNAFPFHDGQPLEVIARNNWWGHASGPHHDALNPSGQGDLVNDSILFDPWRGSRVPDAGPPAPPPPSTRNPVIIVPGILGSELYNGNDLIWINLSRMLTDIGDQFITDNLNMDEDGNSLRQITLGDIIRKVNLPAPVPDADYFDFLIRKMELKGYTPDGTYFVFPYDWRLDLNISSERLKEKIDDVKSQTGALKIDILAHSMGGLLVKNYLSKYGKISVDKLIFIGTPHLGAPKAGKVLLHGDRFGIYQLEPKRIKELSRNSISLYELLPIQEYFNRFTGYIKPFVPFGTNPPLNYLETKTFLLNKDANPSTFDAAESFFSRNLDILDLSGLNAYNIAGCRSATQAGYQYLKGNTQIGLFKYTSGDETVPLISADYINISASNKYYVKNGKHAELPSTDGVRDLILQILLDEPINVGSNVSNSNSFCKIKGKETLWKSPVEVHIYDSLGNHTGPVENNGIEYGVPGVDYEIIDEEKFVFLPTDDGQIYNIVSKGLANGTFDLQISENDDGEVLETIVFNNVGITPSSIIELEISESVNESINLDVQGNGDFQEIFPDAIISGLESEDLTTPETQISIDGLQGNNNWFKSNVEVSLSASDDNSGVLETKYSLDGVNFSDNAAPLVLSEEGPHTLSYFSTDRAGNDEEIKSREINIDFTPPEAQIHFDPIQKDLIFTGIDNLSDVTIVDAGSVVTLTDEAGNTTKLYLQEKDRKRSLRAELLKISYNDTEETVNRNRFRFNWSYDRKGQLKELNQTLRSKKEFMVSLEYNVKKDVTNIKVKDAGKIKETKLGLIILNIKTNKGKIEYKY